MKQIIKDKRTIAAVATLGLTAAALTGPIAASAARTDNPFTQHAAVQADAGAASAHLSDPHAEVVSPLVRAAEDAAASLDGAEQFSAYNVSPDRLYEIRRAKWVVEELRARAERGSIAPSSADVKPAVSKATDELIAEISPDVVGQVPAAEVTEALLVEALSTASANLDQEVTEMAAILAQRPAKPDTSATGTPLEVLWQLATDAQADAGRIDDYREAVAGYGNGEIPREYMCQLSTFEWHVLRCDAAIQFERLNAAFRAEFGTDLEVTDSFRSLEQQIEAKEQKPKLAAKPGTSNHGWGQALDFAGGLHSGYDTPEYLWMYANAPLFGWTNPDWARPGGQKAEPWHWEFNAKYAPIDFGGWQAPEWPAVPGPEWPWPDAPVAVPPIGEVPSIVPPIGEVPTQPGESGAGDETLIEPLTLPVVELPQLGEVPAPIQAIVP